MKRGKIVTHYTIDDEEVFAVRRQTLISKVGQQALDAGGVLCRSRFNSQNVLLALCVHAHRAKNVMLSKALPIDVDHQNLDLFPAPLLQLLELRELSGSLRTSTCGEIVIRRGGFQGADSSGSSV
jgi:hypothetical protein